MSACFSGQEEIIVYSSFPKVSHKQLTLIS